MNTATSVSKPISSSRPAPVDMSNREPLPVPYLSSPPEVIDVSQGRQLFVDDYLLDIQTTFMTRVFHKPVKDVGNPILFPQSPEELDPQFPPCAIAKSGGVWFDDKDQLFKMWYMTGYLGYAALATSRDGIHWDRPKLDVVPGTNLILPKNVHPDSGSVIIDHEATDPNERYKMLIREPNPMGPPWLDHVPGLLFTSPDGIHWKDEGKSGHMDDRSTMYYDPFRRKWVQSIRIWHPIGARCRYYYDGDDFLSSTRWNRETMVPWLRADHLDQGNYNPAQLYNFDAIAYESLMIGFHQILHGPHNGYCEKSGIPKLTELYLSTSRDGLNWHRPDRTPFLGARREYGSWEYGYVESTAGMCLIVGEELWIYYSAYAGDPNRITPENWRTSGIYANGAVGLARLRRDGFASMRPGNTNCATQTRKLRFEGSRLFLNANTASSHLSVQVLDEDKKPIPGLTYEDCESFIGNSTCTEIRWKSGKNLAGLGDKKVSLQFRMDRGDLYSFWITDSAEGKSGGYIAAGGPGLNGDRDI
jgi:hypothetical protein